MIEQDDRPDRQPEEDEVLISPTVILRKGEPRLGVPELAVTMGEGADEALIVFRGADDARAYQRAAAGKHSAAEGFEVVDVNLEGLSALLDGHGLGYVAMPERWTGRGGVDLFDAGDFLAMLEGTDQG